MGRNQPTTDSKHASATMPISLNRDLGKYENSNARDLESRFMASVQSGQGTHCPLTESYYTECINEEQRPG